METTRLSTKGPIVLPKKGHTSLDEVAGCLRFESKPKTLAQMRAAIKREVIRRYKRSRN